MKRSVRLVRLVVISNVTFLVSLHCSCSGPIIVTPNLVRHTVCGAPSIAHFSLKKQALRVTFLSYERLLCSITAQGPSRTQRMKCHGTACLVRKGATIVDG